MIQYLYLGRVEYDEALRLQQEVAELRVAGRIPNTLLLLEHEPVLTLGRNADRSNVLASDEMLAARGVRLHQINRGGDVTYHGPGQLIGYPIFDLRSMVKPTDAGLQNQERRRIGPVDLVRLMEEALIRLCGVYGVRAGRIAGLTGVWCGTASGGHLDETRGPEVERKIAAIGIHVSRGVVTHGFALNVTTNLEDFKLINPCGITDRPVTSLAREAANAPELPGLETIANHAARQFGLVFREQILAVASLDALRAQARGAEPAEAEDTPLSVPRAEGRLHGDAEVPLRA